MESWEEYQASQKSYTEMLEMAQKMHPDMKVRLDLITHSEWEFYMPTKFIEKYELSETFKGTRAWEWYEERDSSYDNQLQRYRHKNGYDSIPLEGVAEYVNLREEQEVWARPVRAELHAKNGSGITESEWATVQNEKFMAYRATESELNKLVEIEFKDKWEALNEKWEF